MNSIVSSGNPRSLTRAYLRIGRKSKLQRERWIGGRALGLHVWSPRSITSTTPKQDKKYKLQSTFGCAVTLLNSFVGTHKPSQGPNTHQGMILPQFKLGNPWVYWELLQRVSGGLPIGVWAPLCPKAAPEVCPAGTWAPTSAQTDSSLVSPADVFYF